MLLYVGLGIILVTILVLYFGLFKKTAAPQELIPSETATTAIPKVSKATEEKLKKINLDFDFLNTKIIPFLKIHGKIPVTVDETETGRDNPFIPY